MKNISIIKIFKLLNILYLVILFTFFTQGLNARDTGKIDRKTVISRHNIDYNKPEFMAPVTLGNGKFAFTVDPTGLQTFAESYNKGIALGTMAEYGWHNTANPNNYKIEDTYKEFDSHGRKVIYAYDRPENDPSRPGKRKFLREAGEWLYENPTRIGLGRIGLVLTNSDGRPAKIEDIQNIKQHLELWSGKLESYFELEGYSVFVETVVHPQLDMVAVRVKSQLINLGRLKIGIRFPYVNGLWGGAPEDWESPGKHNTLITAQNSTRVDFKRKLDETVYFCSVTFPKGVSMKEEAMHKYMFSSSTDSKNLELEITFGENAIQKQLPDFAKTKSSTTKYWNNYWEQGAIVDLSESKDPRWRDLEKRIVLSQYVTAVNCAGSLPPQETGLVQNSWHGKFHMEMHWWHDAHFALWGRISLLMRSMEYYKKILPSAKARAQLQGYKGARWPKMVGPEGREAPNAINPFLVWQQPHPLYFAELCYREAPTKKTLEQWWDIVQASADFMATFVVKDEKTGIFDIGPPLNDVGEKSTIDAAKNTPFEVAYFRFGLKVARQWRERMGKKPDPLWDAVFANLAPTETVEGSYKLPTTVIGLLPIPANLDNEMLQKCVERSVNNMKDGSCSWAYPLAAMAAARVGRPDLAIKALLFQSVSNGVSSAGYNFWNVSVPVYLPGNGALLAAVAMMAGGWDGAPKKNAPGFPDDGQWVVKSEGLQPMP